MTTPLPDHILMETAAAIKQMVEVVYPDAYGTLWCAIDDVYTVDGRTQHPFLMGEVGAGQYTVWCDTWGFTCTGLPHPLPEICAAYALRGGAVSPAVLHYIEWWEQKVALTPAASPTPRQ